MLDSLSIRLLEDDNNRRGDLFGRLMADLFVALGYERPRVNIHKSGRELDLSADHRLETRRAIGECKATAQPIGGDDLNKFVGVLDVEREDKIPLTGYFISLAGFKETAIEQEKQRRRTKIITLTAAGVVCELVKGRILIPHERATELAGRCCVGVADVILDTEAEVLAHQRGWIWAIYYTQGKVRTHFALIHSDGTPLARMLADEIVDADRRCGGGLANLTCLNPQPAPASDTDPRVADALAAYRQYLTTECGSIQLDGLPADSDVGSRRLRIENLFVPLHLDLEGRTDLQRQAVGHALSRHPRLALLAAPGGGKSTLLKRLAVAYAEPTRQAMVDDDLPSRDWLPLFCRCRELRALARGSFADLLDAIAHREPVRQHASVFRAYIDRELLAGRVLLLVDGLDEISDSGDRAAFVCAVRTALQAYPQIAVVATSREAGFRHVAAHLAPVCTRAVISPLNEEDIRRLSVAWHREVVNDTDKVRSDAEVLAKTIVRNDRIKRLAVNPLLLTTLLLVKRWVGSLPTRRAVLYGKAVEVLLMTWNTEGHEPIPEEEALPQLCYVASAMMLSRVERISRPNLSVLLRDARSALPSELGYVKGTVEDFINRVEDRSSLLMMTGNDIENGRLVEFFEFRHLTFQEFLTARAFVEGWHPGRNDTDTLVSSLRPHVGDEKWREVIPLAALLGGKATEPLIQELTVQVRGLDREQVVKRNSALPTGVEPHPLVVALGDCLADEVPSRPATIRAALFELVRAGKALDLDLVMPALASSRYGMELRDEARKVFVAPNTDWIIAGEILLHYSWSREVRSEDAIGLARASVAFVEMLESSDIVVRCEGARALARVFYRLYGAEGHSSDASSQTELIDRGGAALVSMVFANNVLEQYYGCLALVWIGASRTWIPRATPDLLGRLFKLWKHSQDKRVRDKAAWSLAALPLAQRETDSWCADIPKQELPKLEQPFDRTLSEDADELATLVVAWYSGVSSEANIAQRARALLFSNQDLYNRDPTKGRTLRELMARLSTG